MKSCSQDWDYRVVNDGKYHFIAEVHYDLEGKPVSCFGPFMLDALDNDTNIPAEGILRWKLEQMVLATKRDVIKISEFQNYSDRNIYS